MIYKVEKDWITGAGLRAVIIMGELGHHCGYVGVPAEHPLFGVDYNTETDNLMEVPEGTPLGKRSVVGLLSAVGLGRIPRSPIMAFDVHGGVTYAGGSKEGSKYPVQSNLWWYGYDCAHCDDAPSPNHTMAMQAKYPDKPFMWGNHWGEFRDLDYCTQECENLARQIVAQTIVTNAE